MKDEDLGEIIEPDDSHDLDPDVPRMPDDYVESDYTAEQLATEPEPDRMDQ